MRIADFQVGQNYTNREIVEAFKCGNMGGMRRSKQTNSLVLIAKYDGCYRQHEWDQKRQILNYMGMGKVGDQRIDYAQNKTLAESRINGIALHLFEVYEPGVYHYTGEVELASEPFTAIEADEHGEPRSVIKFPLKPVCR